MSDYKLDFFEYTCLTWASLLRTGSNADIFDALNSIRASNFRKWGTEDHPSGFQYIYSDLTTIFEELDSQDLVQYGLNGKSGYITITRKGLDYLSENPQPKEPSNNPGDTTHWDR